MKKYLCIPLCAAAMTLAACQQDLSDDGMASEPNERQERAITGENLGGTNLGGANLGGANLSGTNLGGANLGGTNLGGTNLGGVNLGGTNLGGPNLAGNNLSGTNLSGSNLSGTNLSGTNLSGTNLSGSNLSGTNLSGSNLSGSNLSGTNLAGVELFGNSVLMSAAAGKDIHVINDTDAKVTATGAWVRGATAAYSIQGNIAYATAAGALTIAFNGNGATLVASKTTASGIMRVKLDGVQVAMVDLYSASSIARAEVYTTPAGFANGAHTMTLEWTGTKNAASTGTTVWFDALRVSRVGKMLLTGEDVFHADNKNATSDNSCVVMGIGSTAFTRLVTANTGANMYGLIAKLPWGFKADPTGPQTLDAWEVLVWGSNSYCTFVVLAPVGTTYDGVRGFVKAVFRWNAPPSKSISLGAIGGGVSIVTYTGMMNAAAKFADGTLSDTNLVAAELSFVTATTNNVSVNVDFASWVKLKDNSFYVLGNPSVVSGITQYNEGSYTSALNADGSTAVYTIYNELGVYGGTLEAAYSDFLAGRRGSAPVPKRCAGAKRLFTVYGVPVPTGKCDTGVDFLYAGATVFQAGGWSWKSIPGGVANSLTTYMLGYNSVFYNGVTAPIVGGTHVYVNELPYD